MLRSAQWDLEHSEEMEINYQEIADDARFSNQVSVSLFSVSSALSGGASAAATGGKIAVAASALTKAITSAVFYNTATSAVGTYGMIIAGLATGATALTLEFSEGFYEADVTVDGLIYQNKRFDKAIDLIRDEISKVNLNYSHQLTDILGFRDRRTTAKLADLASKEREVNEMRLEYVRSLSEKVSKACE